MRRFMCGLLTEMLKCERDIRVQSKCVFVETLLQLSDLHPGVQQTGVEKNRPVVAEKIAVEDAAGMSKRWIQGRGHFVPSPLLSVSLDSLVHSCNVTRECLSSRRFTC